MSFINAQAGSSLQPSALIGYADNTSTLTFQTNSTTALIIDSSQNPNCTSTGAISIPSGTTAQRPSSPVEGMVRYNTTIPCLEGYANGTWVTIR